MIGTDHVVRSEFEAFDSEQLRVGIAAAWAKRFDELILQALLEDVKRLKFQPSPERALLGEVRLRSAVHPVSIS